MEEGSERGEICPCTVPRQSLSEETVHGLGQCSVEPLLLARLQQVLKGAVVSAQGGERLLAAGEAAARRPEVPPRVEYSVTPLGLSLNDAVTAMSKWGKQHESWKAGQRAAA